MRQVLLAAAVLLASVPALASDIHIVSGASSAAIDTTTDGVIRCTATTCDLSVDDVEAPVTIEADNIVVDVAFDATRVTLYADVSCSGAGEVTANAAIDGALVYTHGDPDDLDGSGALAITVLLDDATDLANLTSSGDYALNCDIDAGTLTTHATFSGTLDGQLHAITDASINGAGLFGTLQSGASVHDLVLVRFAVTGTSTGVGALAGTIASGVLVDNLVVLAADISGANAVGGLAGQVTGAALSNVYVTGAVSGGTSVGGVVGTLDGVSMGSSGSLTNAASKASVTATTAGGGLVGNISARASIATSWSAGAVNVGGGAVGAGTQSSVDASVYWDTAASGQSTSNGGTGLTAAQMLAQANFSGFDFTNTWAIRANVGRPYLRALVSVLDTTLAVTGNGTSTVGDVVNFVLTATPRSAYAPATGTVILRDSATTIGTSTLTGSTATISYAALTVGSHAISARSGGDDYHLEASAPAVTHVVNAIVPTATTTTTLAASPTEVTFGGSVVLTASVAADTGTPSGTVTFLLAGESVAEVALASGVATTTLDNLPEGVSEVSAAFVPDSAAFAASSSATVEITVDAPLAPVTFGVGVAPAKQTVFAGGAARYIVTVAGSGDVTLICGELPRNVACSFENDTVSASSQGTLVALNVTSMRAHSSAAGPLSRPPWWLLGFGGAMAGLVALSRRRLAIVAFACALACTDDSGRAYTLSDGTPPGAYTITVTGTSNGATVSAVIIFEVAEDA